jgi:HTH-type transcriptional regulator, transcriptional repressor of NAD biosynthesis genes
VNGSFRHGLVIGKFYPPHAGHHFLIRTAAASCDRVTVVPMAADVESIPLRHRIAWLREAYAGQPHVSVSGSVDNLRTDYGDEAAWIGHVALMRAAVGQGDHAGHPVDAVFTSEDYGAGLARRFGAADVRLDPARSSFAVSGTAIRTDPSAHWDRIEPPVRAWFAKRVVVVGAESTGTTTLARDLAAALRARGGPYAGTEWVPEYGREYTVAKLAVARAKAQLGQRSGTRMAGAANDPATSPATDPTIFDLDWTDADFEQVALRQCTDEDAAARRGGPVLVCDTDALATTIWQLRYTGQITEPVRHIAADMPARALYILTSEAGVPFEDDGLRDGEHLRAWMNDKFRSLLASLDVPWLEVHGDERDRLNQALAAVDKLLADGWQLAAPLE